MIGVAYRHNQTNNQTIKLCGFFLKKEKMGIIAVSHTKAFAKQIKDATSPTDNILPSFKLCFLSCFATKTRSLPWL